VRANADSDSDLDRHAIGHTYGDGDSDRIGFWNAVCGDTAK
jgi:hypothetical protein